MAVSCKALPQAAQKLWLREFSTSHSPHATELESDTLLIAGENLRFGRLFGCEHALLVEHIYLGWRVSQFGELFTVVLA